MAGYLYTEGLSVGYGGRPLLEHIALSVRRGEIVTLIGPNGAGKSTILKSLSRQLPALAGRVVLDGAPLARLGELELARRMALVTTDRVDPELMTCWDVVSTGRYPYTGRLGILSPEDRRIVTRSLEQVHAGQLAHQLFARISDGQRQRVLLARAICQQPDVILLDEPTSFLDIRHKLELLEILKELVRTQHLAAVLSLHELDLAQKISDTVVCVQGDAIGPVGPPEAIFRPAIISRLYHLPEGRYSALLAGAELAPVAGPPRVFVIGGGGSGIPAYRLLQRRGVPFAAGVLQANDLDYPVARALAAELVEEGAYQPIGGAALERARALMASCERVVCTLSAFGPGNAGNELLWQQAGQAGKQTDWRTL